MSWVSSSATSSSLMTLRHSLGRRPAQLTVTLMAALAAGEWVVADAAEPPARREASGLVAALLQWHLERGLRSLPLVDRSESAPRREMSLLHEA